MKKAERLVSVRLFPQSFTLYSFLAFSRPGKRKQHSKTASKGTSWLKVCPTVVPTAGDVKWIVCLMSPREVRKKRQEVILRKRDLRKQILQAQMELAEEEANEALLDLAAEEHAAAEQLSPVPENKTFIEKHRDQLEPDDLEFMEEEFCSTAEAIAYTGIKQTTFRKHVKNGEIDFQRAASGRLRFPTAAVVGFLINAKTKETS